MKILNGYAGIGGNRKWWDPKHRVTAVELNPAIAYIYHCLYPQDRIVVANAHEYLLENFMDFDFIWMSPPCQSHSRLNNSISIKKYADMNLYQEILFLKSWFKGIWVIENVIPYYIPLIAPTIKLYRHYFWSNFRITSADFGEAGHFKKIGEREILQEKHGINLNQFPEVGNKINKRQILRNCVLPELGKHILDCATGNYNSKSKQKNLFQEVP